ncbi:ABC transporter permease [Hwanghaeella sp.]|uniref:ABC transporter permease n=1 Tax=Hwanghaeella sp. TaxID=2605943 RepID=UPI003CCB8361
MSEASAVGNESFSIADGQSLKRKLRKATGRARTQALLMVAPLGLFILLTFIFPIGQMLFRSVDDPIVSQALPKTIVALESWTDRTVLPEEEAFAALAEDLAFLRSGGSDGDGRAMIGKLATRMNYETAGVRSTITKTARRAAKFEAPYKEAFIDADDNWGKPEVWATIDRLSGRFSALQFLAALDLQKNTMGEIIAQPPERQIYITLWLRTLWIGFLVTAICVVLAYPVSYLLATLPLRISNLLIICVLLPFWTSLLVRTTSWIVVLGQNGVLLETLGFLGLVGEGAERPQLIYNMTGTIVAMTHILLPFMILPLYSVMKGISPSYMRAARSLGANPALAFVKVYLPQTVPGLGAGCILVFILAIGYYITPALVGGQDGQLISNFIAYHMQRSLNWGLAAALGTMLLAGVLALYWLYDRIVGINNMKLG